MTDPTRRFVRRCEADGVVTVELVGAKSMNILGSEATRELTDEFHRLTREDDCRVVVLRGAGWCLGAGLEVAVSCDLRVAGAGASFGMPEVTVGIPSVIHAALIPAMIGASRAAWLLLTGETIDAGTAASWGLVHDVVPDAELDARIGRLAARIAGLGPQAVRRQKRLLNEWTDTITAQAVENSVEQFGLAFRTGEPQHYMTGFTERQAARRRQRGGPDEPEHQL